jgi:hypothetical protein
MEKWQRSTPTHYKRDKRLHLMTTHANPYNRTLKYRLFQKELCNGIPNVFLLRVLRKRLKTYKLSIAQGVE